MADEIKITVDTTILNAIQADLRAIEAAHKSEVEALKAEIKALNERLKNIENPIIPRFGSAIIR